MPALTDGRCYGLPVEPRAPTGRLVAGGPHACRTDPLLLILNEPMAGVACWGLRVARCPSCLT